MNGYHFEILLYALWTLDAFKVGFYLKAVFTLLSMTLLPISCSCFTGVDLERGCRGCSPPPPLR